MSVARQRGDAAVGRACKTVEAVEEPIGFDRDRGSLRRGDIGVSTSRVDELR